MEPLTQGLSYQCKRTTGSSVWLAEFFFELVGNQTVIVHNDNMTALAYIKKQGGTHSFSQFQTARDLLLSLIDLCNSAVITTFFSQNAQDDD